MEDAAELVRGRMYGTLLVVVVEAEELGSDDPKRKRHQKELGAGVDSARAKEELCDRESKDDSQHVRNGQQPADEPAPVAPGLGGDAVARCQLVGDVDAAHSQGFRARLLSTHASARKRRLAGRSRGGAAAAVDEHASTVSSPMTGICSPFCHETAGLAAARGEQRFRR